MVLFTIVISLVLIGGFIIESQRPKAQLEPVKIRVGK
jgi:hypothetical protein